MTVQSVGTTTNFNYQYEDSLADPIVAKARAEYLFTSGICESDLAVMEGWFGVSGGFGPGNRANVIIERSGSLGSNQGYQTGGTTKIQVAPFDPNQAADDPSLGALLADAQVSAVFAAEFAEVLMDYRNLTTGTTSWGRSNSMGEALSTVCEALRHPDGYYAPANLGPRIGTWLNSSPRPNWIDTTENTDKDFVSIGCGVMFIYYLMSEFNFSIDSVIAAAGTTFEELFQNLTGTSGAWSAFSNTVNAYFPIGTTYQPASDDILPRPGRAPGLTAFGQNLVAAWKGESGDDRLFYAVFDGANWDSQNTIPGNSNTGPSLIAYGSSLFAAWKGEHADQRLFYASFDGTYWDEQNTLPGVASSSSPSLALFINDRLFAAWKGEYADQRLFYASSDGSNWDSQNTIPGVASSSSPSLALYGTRLYAAWKGQYPDQRLFYASFDGSNWSSQNTIPGVASSIGPSLAVYNNTLFAAWKGQYPDQRLFYASFDGSNWNSQNTIPGVASSIGPSLAVYNNALFAAWKGEDADQRLFYASFDGSNWSSQNTIPGNTGPDLFDT